MGGLQAKELDTLLIPQTQEELTLELWVPKLSPPTLPLGWLLLATILTDELA